MILNSNFGITILLNDTIFGCKIYTVNEEIFVAGKNCP